MLCIFQGQNGTLPPGKLHIIILGSEIPKYFNQECSGHELDVQLPSNSYSVLMGIALCVVFVPNKRRCEHPCDWLLSKMNGLLLSCGEYSGSRKEYGTIESHHLWLTYYSDNHLSHPSPFGKEIHLVNLIQTEFINLRLKHLPRTWRWRKLGFDSYTSKTSNILVKLWHSGSTTIAS